MELSLNAWLEETETGILATWEDAEQNVAKTTLFVKNGTPCVVKMQQPQAELIFSPKSTYQTEYRLAEAGSLPITVRTARAEASLTAKGGRVRLDYETLLGELRRRAVVTLHFTLMEEEKG